MVANILRNELFKKKIKIKIFFSKIKHIEMFRGDTTR